MNISGLTSSTFYSISLKALDAAGNKSVSSQSVNVSRTGVVTIGGAVATKELKESAFDGDIYTKWLDRTITSWIQIKYSSATVYDQYSITSANDEPARDPINWTLQGSNDGTVWTILDTQVNQSWPSRFQTKNYIFSNSIAYMYYKVDITANNGGLYIQLAEITFIKDNVKPNAPTSLSASVITADKFLLSWVASFDNIAVSGYDIYQDNVLIATTTGATNVIVSSLLANTTYSMTVFAKDASENISNISVPLSVTTLKSTGIKETAAAWFKVYAKNGQITADLAGVSGESTIKIIDLRGVILKTVKSTETLLNISFPTKGIYLVQVQNGGRSYTQKVVLF